MIGSENNGMYMPVAPAYMGGNCNNGFGDDWSSWIVLFLLFGLFGNGGWGNGFGGGYGTNGLYPWLNNSNQINDGFRDQMLNTTINGIQNGVVSGFGDVQNSLCAGFANINATVNGAQNAISQQLYTNQLADLERSFNAQTATNAQMNTIAASLQNCCCENRSNVADLKYTVATEACADRNSVNNGVRDILTNNTANTQSVLDAIRGISDKLCDQELAAERRENDNLRTQLNMAQLAASQAAQTQMIEQYVRPNPSPAYIVANPYCNYNQNYGCGCGVA